MKNWFSEKKLRQIKEFFWLMFNPYCKVYRVSGTRNRNVNKAYKNCSLEPEFQQKVEAFKENLELRVRANKAYSFYKFGDGDYYFLNGIPTGSAKPGNRALSKPLEKKELSFFRENSLLCDEYLCEIDSSNRQFFREVFPDKNISYPAEAVYGLLANKWILNRFAGKIGLIGADEKIELIKKLMSFDDYQEYLETDGFESYLKIPQRFACDNRQAIYRDLRDRILSSNCRFYLAGIGHLKSGVLGPLAKETGAVILDVGSGIDALAGVISSHRPYFASWTNFRVPNEFDYSKIDLLQYRSSKIVKLR